MAIYKPKMYKKNIYEINYNKLKDMGITTLVFDLDNTLGLIDQDRAPIKTIELIRKLQEDFLVLVCSNNTRNRLRPYLMELGVDGVSMAMKPFTFGLGKIKNKYKLKKKEMAMIGDQIVTDVLSGNKFGVYTVLVDPLGFKDLKITSFNRLIEDMIVKRYSKKGIFERGKYYE
jgi:HAD superfamily (subfamily IIIA) phosphatase